MGEAPVYLDYNATAPIRREAATAVNEALRSGGNPSSVHGAGRRARAIVEEARACVAALVGMPADTIVFTSGGTEANNQAIAAGAAPRRLVTSAIEHDSVRAAARASGVPVTEVAVDGDGVVALDSLEVVLGCNPQPAFVSVMLANNETGVVQPVAEAARIAHRNGAMVHCDAVQAAGRVAIDMAALDCDLLTISAHKLGGPAGVGALVVAPELDFGPLIHGGGQERGRRAGTENLAGIAGFGAAAAAADLSAMPGIAALRDGLERRIAALAGADAAFYGDHAGRVANTSTVGMAGVAAETQVIAFDLAGIAVSAGAACSSGKIERSHVLEAMGVPAERARCAIRVSLGCGTVTADVDRFVAAWAELYRRTRATSRAA